MTRKDELAEQKIMEYQSRLKHIDELYQRAHSLSANLDDKHESRKQLSDIAKQRANLKKKADHLDSINVSNWREEMIESAGPLAVWDVVAQQLE
ncbi:MAG: hypothetical protein KJO62_05225, partial [Gammaproteobacteria bacterium]|nr:hypothetical protein [Gammaproteobacteria bacterium]